VSDRAVFTPILEKSVFRTKDNLGSEIDVPTTPAEDNPYFTITQPIEIKEFYDHHGYVVVRGLLPEEQCDIANKAFDRECYVSKKHIYRQTTANPERNVFTANGFVLNSLSNVQSINPEYFPDFRNAGVEILTAKSIQDVCRIFFGESGKIVQSMYFHGNPSTWPHQDTYYLDAEDGRMTAVWIATEDIQAGAGRFFICPGSHRIEMPKNGGDFDMAYNQDRYKQMVEDTIRDHQLLFVAPALNKGDALFWGSKTIHGSLPTSQPEFSRRSFTAHLIPDSQRFLKMQSQKKNLPYHVVNGVKLFRPKDQAILKNRLILLVEVMFPKTFQALKKLAIKLLVR
jgi:phytanoyl-CoA hydroxylase